MSEQKFIIENDVLIKYKGADENVIIPEGVKAIGDNAFYDKETIKSIIIPDGVKAIGNAVFYGCENLKKITIPNSVETIGAETFCNCKTLKELNLPESIQKIGEGAFSECTSLTKINIPKKITKIEDHTFYNCIRLKKLNFTNAIEEINGDYTFRHCRSLTIYAPENSVAISYAQKKFIAHTITNIDDPNDIKKSKEEKIAFAVKKFVYNVSQIETKMKRLNYSSVYPSENNTFYPRIDKNADTEAALEFFSEIEKILLSDGVGFDEKQGATVASIISEIKKEFLAIVKNKKTTNTYYGTYHIRTFVAVGLACYYFLSTKTRMDLEFNRDKWESAGDYCSTEKIAFRISAIDNGGKVLTKKHEAYDNFG